MNPLNSILEDLRVCMWERGVVVCRNDSFTEIQVMDENYATAANSCVLNSSMADS